MRHSITSTAHGERGQRGAVLFIALVFLLLLTLLALAAAGTSVLQERMTGGLRNGQLGMMGSESALRYAESYLWNLAGRTNAAKRLLFHCGAGGKVGEDGVGCFARTYGQIDPRVERFRSEAGYRPGSASDANVAKIAVTGLAGDEATANLASQPAYIVEDVGEFRPPRDPVGDRAGAQNSSQTQGKGGASDAEALRIYRITARSDGGNTSVQRVSESTFVALIPKSFSPGAGGTP
ncbi:MAG TPA: PilX N-terminal domain-containing pilus assembly protein [Tahibacter sp.]|nr:PilX N-terminal domain-containing pilus assembly protein [Tahibacter sp.]